MDRPVISIEDKLNFGNLTIKEVYTLKSVSHATFYNDVKKGLVHIVKLGHRSVVPGPVAKRYIAGLPRIPTAADVPNELEAAE